MSGLPSTGFAGRLPFHYGWLIALAGSAGSMACIGIGRFALGMLLPSMGASLSLSYAEMGFIGTGNFVGYMVSAIVAGHFVRFQGYRRTIAASLAIVAVSMVLVGRASGFAELLFYYFITGLGTGFANIPLMGLVSRWFMQNRRGAAAGIVVGGSGFGVVLSGTLVPAVNAAIGTEGWRTSWMILGAIALVVAALCFVVLRDQPQDLGLGRVGDNGGGENAAVAAGETEKPGWGVIIHLGAIFMAFGFTYSIYTTFIVTTLVDERGFSEAVAGQFWSWVGILSIFSGPLFGIFSDRVGRKAGFTAIFLFHTVAYLLVAADLPDVYLYASIALFGISAWSIPSVMVATVGDYSGPVHAAATMGAVTALFGLGQVMGPAVAGVLADSSGSFAGSYAMAGTFTALSIIVVFFLRRPSTTY